MTRIVFEDVSKIYGDRPRQVQDAMALLRQNVPSDEIFARTGCRVGLRHISLEIPSGGIFCVIGLSGSGKSTLVRHINRLIEPSCGRIQACDTDVTALDARGLREFRRARVSMVFQHFGLLPHLTVMQNTCFGLRVRGLSAKEQRERACHWLREMELADMADSYPEQLSGGMRQIGRAHV